jgi:hypothetical protein
MPVNPEHIDKSVMRLGSSKRKGTGLKRLVLGSSPGSKGGKSSLIP